MTVSLDLASDYLVWDGTEAVTFHANRAEDLPHAVSVAKRRALTHRELLASGGVYTAKDLVWLIPAILLPLEARAADPFPGIKPGDTVVDVEDVTWTVLQADRLVQRTVWKLTTRSLVLAYDLRDTITIERPAVTIDAAGVKVKTWPPSGGSKVYADIAARVQKITDTTADGLGMRALKHSYQAIVDRQLTLEPEDRINWNGTYLEIKGYHNPDRMDELPVIDAEAFP